ncbi:MAG: fatty acid desaturase family protein [Burkholderiaceae bacterium]|nr:fatty acid desaturase family protein [Roseateles sp.]MBV8471226.1 fatty acid desaturase family protein [Burkholderiaceae bacterium]
MALMDVMSPAEFRALTRPSSVWAVWVTAVNVALIAAGFALPALWHGAWAWILGSVLLGGRALALGILVHDTAHLTMFASRRMNEWMGTWVFGGLPNVAFQAYRRGHLAHHRHAGTEADADLAFVDTYPASAASLVRKCLRDVSGVNGVKQLFYQIKTFKWRAQRPFLAAHALLLSALWALGVPQVYACWWLGQIFVFPLVLRLRVMGEHGGVPDHFDADPRGNTGTTLAGPLARLLVGPNRVNFHLEHHLAAAVPSYRLPQMHKMLAERGYYAGWNCIMPSYGAVIRRCWARGATVPALAAKRRAQGSLSNMQ